MATVTLDVSSRFPDGTDLAVYLRRTQPKNKDSAPSGDPVTSGTVGAGEVTFSGLEEDKHYLAIAQLGGIWTRFGFTVNLEPEGVFVRGIEVATKEQLDAALAEVDAPDLSDYALEADLTSEAGTRAAADSSNAGDIAAHEAATTGVHGIDNTAALALTSDVDADITAAKVGAMGVAVYAGDVGAARPTGYGIVYWVFPSQPTNWIEGDLWMNTQTGEVKVRTGTPAIAVANKGFATNGSFTQYSHATIDADISRMVGLGAGWIRLNVEWNQIQAGGSGSFSWTNLDYCVDAAVSAGLKVLATIVFTPSWARAVDTGKYWDAPDPTKLATFAGVAVNRYKDRIKHWEFWNEPNLSSFWYTNSTSGVSAAAYTACLQAIYPAIKTADPLATVITGGLANASNPTSGAVEADPRTFLAQIYGAGGKDYFDAVAMHPYTQPGFPGETQSWNPWYRMTQMRNTMVAQGDAAKPMWITESGCATSGTTAGTYETEAKAAEIIGKGITEWNKLPWGGNNGNGPPILTYEIRDQGTSGDRENFFGAYANGGTAKALIVAAFQAGGVASAGAIMDDSPRVYLPMEEASGYPQDASGNGAHVTAGAATAYHAAGAVDFAITFNGTSDGFRIPDPGVTTQPVDVGNDFTLEAWIKRDGTSRSEAILHKGADAFALQFDSGDNYVHLRKSGVGYVARSNVAITDTSWHHVAVTRTGTTTVFYIDGAASGTTNEASSAETIQNNDLPLAIGYNYNGGTPNSYFDGSIDEVAIFGSVLSAARILAHFQEGNP